MSIFMTSCFSGHWVETTDFQGKNLKPVILTGAEKDGRLFFFFGYAWSHAQRHAGGLFSSTAVSELVKVPFHLPDKNTFHGYHELTTALVAEMRRLCLPINIQDKHGSSPVFSDAKSQEKLWKRTGYHLHQYQENYDNLPTAPASAPHPSNLDENFPQTTGGYGRTRRGLLSSSTMNYSIGQYLYSKPGSQIIEHRALIQVIREFYGDALNDTIKSYNCASSSSPDSK